MQPGLSPRQASTSVSCLLEEERGCFLDDLIEHHLHVADFLHLPPRHYRLTATRLLVLARGCQARRTRTNLDLNRPEDLSSAASRSAWWERNDRESSGLARSYLHQARQVHCPSSVGGTWPPPRSDTPVLSYAISYRMVQSACTMAWTVCTTMRHHRAAWTSRFGFACGSRLPP